MPRGRGKTGATHDRKRALEAAKQKKEVSRGHLARALSTCPFCYVIRTSEATTCETCKTSLTEATGQGSWRQRRGIPSSFDADQP